MDSLVSFAAEHKFAVIAVLAATVAVVAKFVLGGKRKPTVVGLFVCNCFLFAMSPPLTHVIVNRDARV